MVHIKTNIRYDISNYYANIDSYLRNASKNNQSYIGS